MSTAPTPRDRDARVFPNWPSEHVRSLILLNEATRKINSVLDLDALLDMIVNEVASVFGCSVSGIALLDPESGDLVTAAMQGGVVPKGEHFRIGVDGMIGHAAAIGKMYYSPDVSKDPYYIDCTPETRSEVDIPLKVGDELIGIFCAQHPNLDAFSHERLHVLQVLADHIAIAVHNARRFERERAEKQQLYSQHQEAAAIQQSLFPKVSPKIDGLEVEGRCLTAHAVGGDWFDYIPLADGRWAFVLADVSGKGLSAALLMTSSRGTLRSLVETTPEPAALLTRLNRIFHSDLPPGRFITMVYAVFDPSTRVLKFANAGHPWPIVADDDGTRLVPTNCGLPLGIDECEYDEHTVVLDKRQRVLLYSDGITESENLLMEQFGVERLRQCVADPDFSLNKVFRAMCEFAKCSPLADDATLILLKSTR